jgi:hypothetical protein
MERAKLTSREGYGDKLWWMGEIEGIRWVRSFDTSEQACREELAENVRGWVLLGMARGEDWDR